MHAFLNKITWYIAFTLSLIIIQWIHSLVILFSLFFGKWEWIQNIASFYTPLSIDFSWIVFLLLIKRFIFMQIIVYVGALIIAFILSAIKLKTSFRKIIHCIQECNEKTNNNYTPETGYRMDSCMTLFSYIVNTSIKNIKNTGIYILFLFLTIILTFLQIWFILTWIYIILAFISIKKLFLVFSPKMQTIAKHIQWVNKKEKEKQLTLFSSQSEKQAEPNAWHIDSQIFLGKTFVTMMFLSFFLKVYFWIYLWIISFLLACIIYGMVWRFISFLTWNDFPFSFLQLFITWISIVFLIRFCTNKCIKPHTLTRKQTYDILEKE